jgi:peptide/nickel transport system permease protein
MTITAGAGTATALDLQGGKKRKQRSLWGDAWVQFRRNKLAIFGLVMLVTIVIAVLVGPWLYPVDPKAIDILASSQAPSAAHPMGTDDLGRDMLARVLYGGRISLAVGFTAMFISILVGTTVGLSAGYIQRLDGPLMRFTDMMLTLPQIPLLLVAMGLFRDPLRQRFGLEIGAFIMVVTIIGILGWMPTGRLVRGSVLSLKQKEFVEAAVNVGARSNSIMTRHILPNVLGIIIVSATLEVAAAILTESTLSFLGVGFPPDVPTWGSLLYYGRNYMTQFPWMVLFPGLMISLTILAINFIGDGLRDALDPRQRR